MFIFLNIFYWIPLNNLFVAKKDSGLCVGLFVCLF